MCCSGPLRKQLRTRVSERQNTHLADGAPRSPCAGWSQYTWRSVVRNHACSGLRVDLCSDSMCLPSADCLTPPAAGPGSRQCPGRHACSFITISCPTRSAATSSRPQPPWSGMPQGFWHTAVVCAPTPAAALHAQLHFGDMWNMRYHAMYSTLVQWPLGDFPVHAHVDRLVPRLPPPPCVCIKLQMKQSTVVGSNGSSVVGSIRTSYGTFLA
jgi:hypothetical protein